MHLVPWFWRDSKKRFPFLYGVFDFLYHCQILCKGRLCSIQILSQFVLATADITELIPEYDHVGSQCFHGFCKSGQSNFYCLYQLLHPGFRLPQESVVRLNLTIQFTPVRNNTLFLQHSCSHAFMHCWLFIKSPFRMAAIVYAFCSARLLQMKVYHICPCLTPENKLFFSVPSLGNGILPAKFCALWIFVDSHISQFINLRGRHIHFLFSDLVGINSIKIGASRITAMHLLAPVYQPLS